MHLLLFRTSRKKKIDSSKISSQCTIEKKRPVYMHIVIYIVNGSVCGLPGPRDKDDSARRIWILDIIFSHVGNERACALHPQE